MKPKKTSKGNRAHALNEPQDNLEQLVEATAGGIILLDDTEKICMVSQGVEKLFGYRESELIGQKMDLLLPDSCRLNCFKQKKDLDSKSTSQISQIEIDLFGRKANGARFPVEIDLSSFHLNEKRFLTVYIADSSNRRKREEALSREREKLQKYLDVANALFVVIGTDERVLAINKKGCEVLGYAEEEIVGSNWFDRYVPSYQRDEIRKVFQAIMNGKEEALAFYESDVISRNKQVRAIEWHNALIYNNDGSIAGTMSSGVDITRRKKMEAEILNAVHEGQEKERERIAQDLHDNLGQRLAALKMMLSSMKAEMRILNKSTFQVYKDSLKILENLIKETRIISHGLTPAEFDEGLIQAIHDLCRRTEKGSNLKISFHGKGADKEMPMEVVIGLFRILQELLNNILRHAYAKRAFITFGKDDEQAVLSVKDDGIGFDGNVEEMHQNGIGLRNVAARVKGLHGKLSIDSTCDTGTSVTITIPLKH